MCEDFGDKFNEEFDDIISESTDYGIKNVTQIGDKLNKLPSLSPNSANHPNCGPNKLVVLYVTGT